MANTPHRATCGTCGGNKKTYSQSIIVKQKRYLDKDTGDWIPEITEMVVSEHTCKTCEGLGVR